MEMPSNRNVPWVLIVVDGHRHGIADRDLVADDPLLEAAGAPPRGARESAAYAGRPSKVLHAVEPAP